jgi:Ti-type conjugative transfer relaxase TraA
MTPRINVGKGVTGAVRYVLGQGRDPKTGVLHGLVPGEDSRVDWIGGTGFGFTISTEAQADLARRIMEFDALNQNGVAQQDCVHLSLSWRIGEKPTREQMEEAAHSALQDLGMANAKALFVAHNDEDYAHVHIVASKINPETGYAYDLKGSWRTLSRWAETYELEHGGIISIRRQTANELRAAIKERDAEGVLEALTKQRATFTADQLERALQKEIQAPQGATTVQKAIIEEERKRFSAEILNHSTVVPLAETHDGPTARYSTKTVIEAELHVLRAAAALNGADHHSLNDDARSAVAADRRFAGMTQEQGKAFRHATGPEGLAIIDGQAGTGKSFTIGAIREAYENAGSQVIGLAPTNAVAQDMKGDGFGQASTIHAELFALNNNRTSWRPNTVVIVDEAAMLDTKLMAMVTAHAHDARAKLILVGDDRQLSSIDRGGMFGALKDRYGAAALSEVKRQHKVDERRAAEMMAEGNFHDALNIYNDKGAIHWTRTQGEARAELIEQWAKDSAAHPEKSKFVFAYTNDDVGQLNTALRSVRKARGELGEDQEIDTAYGRLSFATGDRIQFTGTDKVQGIHNGVAGTIAAIEGTHLAVRLDGQRGKIINFDAANFDQFRHGYAGTIYKGQGKTLDQTYLYHTEHWRSAASYVALTRHRDKAELFVARNTAKDVTTLARQMARVDDRRAASMFHHKHHVGPVRPLKAAEILAEFGGELFRPSQRPKFSPDDEHEAGPQQKTVTEDKVKNTTSGPQAGRAGSANDHQKPFTEQDVYRDPWSAVYRTIPSDADRTLLQLARAAVSCCRNAVAGSPGSSPTASSFMPTDLGKDATPDENLRRAEARLAELEHRLRAAPEEATPSKGQKPVPEPPQRTHRSFGGAASAFFTSAENVVSWVFNSLADIIAPSPAPPHVQRTQSAAGGSATPAQKSDREAARETRLRYEQEAAAYWQSLAREPEQNREQKQEQKNQASNWEKTGPTSSPDQSENLDPTVEQDREIGRTQGMRRSR